MMETNGKCVLPKKLLAVNIDTICTQLKTYADYLWEEKYYTTSKGITNQINALRNLRGVLME
jgi:hypothetical protein